MLPLCGLLRRLNAAHRLSLWLGLWLTLWLGLAGVLPLLGLSALRLLGLGWLLCRLTLRGRLASLRLLTLLRWCGSGIGGLRIGALGAPGLGRRWSRVLRGLLGLSRGLRSNRRLRRVHALRGRRLRARF